MLKSLHEKNKSILNYLADADNSVELAIHVGRSESSFTKAGKVDESVYVWLNTSTQYKVNLLLKFFALFGEKPENLVLMVQDAPSAPEDAEGRYALRRRFWTQALPSIRSATGTFSNVNPSKENYVMGATGCLGIYYICVANYDCARVELYIGTSDKALNKAVFDALEKQHETIEDEYGSEIQWQRMEDKIASRICDQLNDVSIANEVDWPKIIEFQSQQTAKLKNALQQRLEIAFAAAHHSTNNKGEPMM